MLGNVLEIFYKLTTIPHGSGNTDEMREFIESFALRHGYDIKQDKAKNLLVYKKDSKANICLQSHYDMVCVGAATNQSPLTLIQNKITKDSIEQTWLKAKDSSLGADNGMGMAIMLYLLTKSENIECLFTNDEEIGMIGAKNLELPIESKVLINLDSEVLGEVTIGCAGGYDLWYKSDFKTQIIEPNWHYYVVQSHGFAGGHSGLDINNTKQEFQNAVIASIDFIKQVLDSQNTSAYIINWQGGEKRNSIPINSKIIIALENQLDMESITKIDSKFFSICELEAHKGDGKIEHNNEIFLDTPRGIPLDTLHSLIKSVKIGVLDDGENCVQNSLSLSHIFFANGHLELAFMGRANTKELLDSNLESLKIALSKKHDLELENSKEIKADEYYVPWEKQKESKDKESPLNIMLGCMDKNLAAFNITPKVVELHAGLECGVLLSCFENMGLNDITALSIGPTINSPHSLNECVWIESVGITLNILEDFIKRLNH